MDSYAKISLQLAVIDRLIEKVAAIREKAHHSSPTSRMSFAISMPSELRGLYLPDDDYREQWPKSKDGIAFEKACRDINRLKELKEYLLSKAEKEILPDLLLESFGDQ